MSNETKTKTCSRCKGKGSVTSSVVYSGTPGGCFKCNGNGVLRWETADEINDRREQDKPRAFAVIEEQANELKAAHQAFCERRQRLTGLGVTTKPLARTLEIRTQELEHDLAALRARWQDVKNQPPVSRGRWVTL